MTITDRPAAVHELGVAEAAEAVRTGALTARAYAAGLLDRAERLAGLNAFITLDPEGVLRAAETADEDRAAGAEGPLLGVPLGVKDSALTRGLPTTFGNSALRGFVPTRDAQVVTAVKNAGALVFGKTNLAEMSFGVTGLNAHHGQVLNPHRPAHVSGGSSSGSAAAVAAGIVPAALAGDTIGSIRIPAALCGVVGFKPSRGRWPGDGVAPVSTTLDSTGVIARSVADCALVDGVVTGAVPGTRPVRGVRLGYSPRHLAGADPEVASAFDRALGRLEDAGARLVEVELGEDFFELAESATWPIFFHETLPSVREFLRLNDIPVTFEQIAAGLGEHVKARWDKLVVPGAPNAVDHASYRAALDTLRPALAGRYRHRVFRHADALLFPTTLCAAPPIEHQWEYPVGTQTVTDLFLARTTHPTNCAGLPGLTVPMGTTAGGLPLGLELDGAFGTDRALLAVAAGVEDVLGRAAPPAGLPS
ncbi:amidase family protein [Amycolatopsis rhabdoformis]|uniref:Amidase family protein n=1 Tax=Amycolatopsis rhabdoformis TaxID=1448059 RepID=A0ABZ1IEJ5_9PSEU|nr:amidase family protein [Amycolatopsis rhabdoformis]WSE32511.1 amidase family protein [Amycolatopsis rhabdoformis]